MDKNPAKRYCNTGLRPISRMKYHGGAYTR